ncbi:Ig-like domain-containing protein [Acetobacterium bakii]|uniref:Ig-like domain-containing protein n=1 Tax=Acetobacterium bakii TaxID=52689 RepID=UPI000682A0D1|nr:Ig-like domain-containing protein [Acetobacterium bakii]
MKNNLAKNILSFMLIVTLLFTSNLTCFATGKSEALASEANESITITVETFTLAGGFVVKPTQVALNQGETLGNVLNRVLGSYLVWNGNSLDGIIGAQSGNVSVPGCISAMGVNDNGELAPTLKSIMEIGLKSGDRLGEHDYSSMSGWRCSINNELRGNSIAGYVPAQGDVVRLQFSLWGDGGDLGQTLSGGVPAIYTADKDLLISTLGSINASPYFSEFMTDNTFSSTYSQAVSIAENLQASQNSVDAVCNELNTLLPIPTKSISLPMGTLEMDVNQSFGFEISILPENATIGRDVSWQSSNPDVVEVDGNGVVTGVAPGSATITALTTTGGLSTSCNVNVKAIPITEIQMNISGLALENNGSYQLCVFYFPENTTDAKAVEWFSSDTAVAVVSSSGLVTAAGKGTATITAQTPGGITGACQVTVATAAELAGEITEKINGLPKVGALRLADKAALEAVRAEYDASPENAKNQVTSSVIEKLNALIKRMDELESNQELANKVMEAIGLLPPAESVTLQDEEDIKSARNAYETGLNREQQTLIQSELLDQLENCEKRILEIRKENEHSAQEVMASISDLPQASAMTLADAKQVSNVRKAFETLTTDQQSLIKNLDFLSNAEIKIIDLIKIRIAGIDEKTITANSSKMKQFLDVGKAYDGMTDSEKNRLDGETKDKLLRIQATLKAINGTNNDITVDAPWYVALQGKLIKENEATYKKFIQMMAKEKISSENTSLLKLYKLSLTDLSNYNMDYVSEADDAVTVSLPLSSEDQAWEKLSVVTQAADGTIKVINKDQYSISENRIIFRAANITLVGLLGEKAPEKIAAATIGVNSVNMLEPEIKTAVAKTSNYMLVAAANPTIQSGLWETVCFARSGYAVPEGYYDLFYQNIVKEFQEGQGSISGDRTNTDYSKTILALTAIGKDPTNVGGYNVLGKLSNFTQIKRGGMMAYVWALIALDSNNYEIPLTTAGTQTTRELLVQTILEREVVTSKGVRGGFSLYSDSANASPDTDVTAMTLQALAKYKDRADVKPVIERALSVLSGLQNSDGSYGTFGAPETSESTSQVVLALTALGIDPAIDSRFIKGDNWVLSDLMTYYIDGGGFMHVKAGETGNGGAAPGALNGMASYQAMQAMISYNRMKSGQSWIFGITDGFKPVINKEVKLDDIQKEYENRYGTTKQGGTVSVAAGGSTSGTVAAAGNTAVAATAASKGGTAAEAFTPWSFTGTYTPSLKSDAAEGAGANSSSQTKMPFIIGGAGIILAGAAGSLIYRAKKKRIKNA